MRRGWALGIAAGVGVAAVLGWGLLRAAGSDRRAPPAGSGAIVALGTPAPLESGGSQAALAQRPQTLPPPDPHAMLFGLEEAPAAGVEYCDDANWSRIDRFVDRVEAGDVYVIGERWRVLAAPARLGIATWALRCNHADRPVALRDAESHQLLAEFDLQRGYRDAPGPDQGR